MRIDSATEQELCNTLKALIEEHGPEVITVCLPLDWVDLDYKLGRCQTVYSTYHTIEIEVNYGPVHIHRIFPLRA